MLRAGLSAAAPQRRGPWRRRSSGGRRAGTRARCGAITRAAGPNSLALIDDRRVQDHDVLLAGRRAVAVNDRHLTAGQDLRELLRITDRRRTADDLRLRAVVIAQPEQAAKHV